ncbi:MAG: DUF1475 family protein [Acidobacteriota bacterium]
MRLPLVILFSGMFLVMVYVTVRAGLAISIWDVWESYAANPWAVATLYDAYSGFTIFWLWVAYRERTWGARALWFVLVMALGNIATSFYLLLQLMRLSPQEPVSNILGKRPA